MSTNGTLSHSLNGNGATNGYHSPSYVRPKPRWKIYLSNLWPYWGIPVSCAWLAFLYYQHERDKVWNLNHLTDNQISELLAPYQPEELEEDDEPYDPR